MGKKLYRDYDNTAVGQTPKFEFPYTFSWGGQKNSAWDNLSMDEKSEMMKVAVKHGITNLSDIRKKYNEYAEGGEIVNEEATNNRPQDEAEIAWMKNWLSQRKNILAKNADKTSWEYLKYEPKRNTGDVREAGWKYKYYGNLLNPFVYFKGYTPTENRVNKLIYAQIENAANTPKVNIGRGSSLDYNTRGVYVPPNYWDNSGHYVAFAGQDVTPEVKIHEFTHASHPAPQEKYINDVIFEGNTPQVVPNHKRSSMDNAKELYGALQEFRFKNGLKPEQIIDQKYIDTHRDLFKNNYLENVSDENKLRLFNEVALKNVLTLDNMAAYGGPLGGNLYTKGGWLSWLTGLFKSEPKHYYKAADGRVYDSKDKAVNRNKELVASKQAYLQKENKATGVKRKTVMRKPNTSPTSEKSQELENRMYTKLDEFGARTGYRTKSYNIPYGDRTITVRPVGSPFSTELSVNALDTVAKYAGITGTPIQTALGLPWHETKFGRIPYYNVGQKGNTFTDRELENANYFKNFGSIPAEYLVRDFRYNGDLVFDGRRDSPIPLSNPPLQHALEYLNAGKYNTKQPHHAQNVENAGNALWNETTGSLLNWWENEGKEWYNKNKYKNR